MEESSSSISSEDDETRYESCEDILTASSDLASSGRRRRDSPLRVSSQTVTSTTTGTNTPSIPSSISSSPYLSTTKFPTTPPPDKKDRNSSNREEEFEFTIKNLDTGEVISSKEIDHRIPHSDPIGLHIRLSQSQRLRDSNQSSSDNESPRGETTNSKAVDTEVKKKKKKWIPRIGAKIKQAKEKRKSSSATPPPTTQFSTYPRSRTESKPKKRTLLAQSLKQQINEHKGAVWTMKFNYDGTYLASGGNDAILRVWKVDEREPSTTFFLPEVIVFRGHSLDILSVSWANSRSNVLLSASMDKSVRMWNIHKQDTCVHVFEHGDVVTVVEMHPKNEELFLSGCLDNQLRIWNIPERRIISNVSIGSGFITSASFSLDTNQIVIGSYDGFLTFIETKGMKEESVIHVKKRTKRKGKKITGIHFHPTGKYVLVTSNDSRIRMIDTKERSIVCTYKGLENKNFQIGATFSEKGKYILSGSEDQHVHIWEAIDTKNVPSGGGKSLKAQSNDSFKAHATTVTVAICAPFDRRKTKSFLEGQIIVSADSSGEMKVWENKEVHSSSKAQ